ncbi:MAG: 2-oxo acid dehydrogenase subunit E2 [Oligoflexia bacterium]|nr:2-oxo acid dehydrogenase subunit E2 [Oligoflexia bacterium]
MRKMTTRRKLAIATWSSPREGNIYGKLTVDATQAMRYLRWLREKTGERVTMTHFVGKALADALATAPGLNGKLLWGRYIPHDSVDIAFLVALEDGADLAKAKIDGLDKKSVTDVARELRALAAALRAGKDSDFEKSKGTIKLLPTWLLSPLLWLTGWLASSLGISIPALGVARYPFGSAVITSVGMFGLDEGFAPPTPFARVPVLVLIGAVRPQPAVEDGQVVVREQITITATIDHRFLDGADGGRLAKVIRKTFADPWACLEGMDAPPEDA